MNAFYVQLSTLLSLLIVNFVAGCVPLFILGAVGSFFCDEHFVHRRKRVVTFLLVCGGGVFMSTCFLVLVPQSRRHFEKHDHAHHTINCDDSTHGETFPIPELVVMCGFFVTFAVEELVHYILYHFQSKKSKCSDVRVRFCSCAKRHTECSRTFKADVPDQTLFGLEKKNSELGLDYSGFIRPNEQTTMNTNLLQSQGMMPNYGSVAADERTNTPVNILTPPPMTPQPSVPIVHQQHNSPNTTHTSSNILLLIVISCHAILQGINTGMIPSPTWTLLFVMCLQQTVLAFVMGNVGMSDTGVLSTTLAFITTMAIVAPLGIGITMIFNDAIRNNLVYGIAKGLLCGSLLYFTFCDLLRRPMLKAEPHPSRFAGFLLGAVIVAVLQYVSVIL